MKIILIIILIASFSSGKAQNVASSGGGIMNEVVKEAAFGSIKSINSIEEEEGITDIAATDLNKLSNLEFGEWYNGYPNSVPITDPRAAKYRFRTDANRPVTFTLTLPSNLNSPNIPLTYSTAQTGWSFTDNPSTAQNFNPMQGVTIDCQDGVWVYFWIGGTINPALQTSPGNYSVKMNLLATWP